MRASPVGHPPECAADGQQLRSRRPVNGAVDASTSKERLVGGVDDGVNVQARDVSLDQISVQLDRWGRRERVSPA